jgi:hypothetical protein
MSEQQGNYVTEEELNDAMAMLKGVEVEEQAIVDQSDLRKYRIELPNLYDDADLDPYEFRLLAHFKRVGRCTEGLKTTAKKCHMSPSQASEKRRSLHDKGWIVMKEVQLKDGGYAYVIFVVDKWRENFEKYTPIHSVNSPHSPRELKNLHDDDFGKVASHWMNTHTFLNPTHSTLLACMLDEWREHAKLLPAGHPDKDTSPADVLIKAADITAKHAKNPHSIAYMDQVVKGFIANGIGNKPKKNEPVRPEHQPVQAEDKSQYVQRPANIPRPNIRPAAITGD